MAIKTLTDTAADIKAGLNTKAARRIPRTVWTIAARKLDLLNAAHELRDLSSVPANRLKPLAGDLAGFYSIRVNQQYRIVFKFHEGNAHDVDITDYH